MKKSILSLVTLILLNLSSAATAQIMPTVSVQGTNATLRWASTPGESYVVLYRRAFHPAPELQWQVIGTNVPAGGGVETFFQHTGGVPKVPASVGGGGGGGSSPPVLQSATSPTTDPTQDKDDKVKAKDSELPAFPSLPDEKEIEKWLKEMLKEYERQQREGGGVPAFTALMASTLTAEQATSNSMGFYVVTRVVDDTDADGLPDWWEAANGLNPLENDSAADPDGDGASNLAEYNYQTNPRNPNSRPAVQLTFTSPVNTSTYLPVIQITGQLNLNLRTISYSVTNASGVLADTAGFVTARTVTPGPGFTNSPSTHSAGFQCFDVPLTNGVNTVGLRFTDAYGLTHLTNVTFTVNFAASPAAPQATLLWPGQGAVIAAETFTLRGRLDNPTAQVVARITLGGTEQEFGGVVERDGTFWLEDLPTPPSGTVQLVATDAAGKASTNTFSVSRSAVTLNLNPPAGPELWNSTVDLSGTVSHTNYVFYVNSRRASVNASGGWIATNVPVNAGGVATFAFRGGEISNIVPLGFPAPMAGNGGQGGLYQLPTGNPGGFGDGSSVDAIFDFDKPPRIVVASYTRRVQDDNPTLTSGHTNRTTFDWTRSGAGYSGLYTSYWLSERYAHTIWWQTGAVTYPFPGTNGTEVVSGFFSSGDPISYTNHFGPPPIPWEQAAINLRNSDRALSEKSQTTLQLMTGGRAVPGAFNAFLFDVPVSGTDAHGAAVTIPSANVRFLGEPLDTNYVHGQLNIPANANLDATPVILLAQSSPAGGGRGSFNVLESGSLVRPQTTPYYVTNQRTNREILHLGYSRAELPYVLTGHGGRPWMHWTQVLGTGRWIINSTNLSGSVGQRYLFTWTGTVPDLPSGPQVRNTRRYVDPTTRELAAAVTVADTGNQLIGTNKMGLLKVAAKAVVGRQTFGNAGHLATIAGSLGAARYTVTQDQNLSLTSATNNMPLGLVWYSISHGRSLSGDFQGLDFGGGQTLTGTNMPGTFNYMLAFLNGCNSANNGAGTNVTALADKFGPDCAVVGWSGAVGPAIAITCAELFFQRLSLGDSVDAAILEVKRLHGSSVAFIGNFGENRFVQDALIVVRGGGVVLDLKP
jgi:hypothetical protein